MIISGQLLTKVGGPIQWATITFDPSIGDSISFETDFEGKYSCNVPVGNYRVYRKEKHDIDIELLGCDIFVSQDSTLDALLDQGIPAFTAATLPDPATLAPGDMVVVDGETRVRTNFGISNPFVNKLSSAIPHLIPSSGIIGANGSLSLTTSLNIVSGFNFGCYMYFPSGAVYSGSVAGLYFVIMNSANSGTVFNDIYVIGDPIMPKNPTPITSPSIGAYTQTTSTVVLLQQVIPGGAMGRQGVSVIQPTITHTNNANSKNMQVLFGGTLIFNKSQTTQTTVSPFIDVKNRGCINRQVSCQVNQVNAFPAASTTSVINFSIDTSQDVVVKTQAQIANPLDYLILESQSIDIFQRLYSENDSNITLTTTPVAVPLEFAGMQALQAPDTEFDYHYARSWDQNSGLLSSAYVARVNNISTSEGVYNWTGFDAFMNTNSGKELVVTLGCPSDWMIARSANGGAAFGGTKSNMVPTGATELGYYVAVVTAMADRAKTLFGKTGIKWELWNEIQNSGSFKDTYTNLPPYAKAVYQAIKAVDSTAIVLSPSCGNEGAAYLLYNFLTTSDGSTGKGGDWIDAICYHMYSDYDSPWSAYYCDETYKLQHVRAGYPALQRYVTESGILSLKTSEFNSNAIARRLLVLISCGVKCFIAYAKDYAINPLVGTKDKWNQTVSAISGKTITKCVKNANGSVTVTFADASTYTV